MEDQNRYLIPSEEYHLIINEINKNDNFPQTHRRESEDSEFSNSDYGEHRNPRKRNFVKMESYNEESYNN